MYCALSILASESDYIQAEVYRLLERKLNNLFTCHTIVTTLQDMKPFYIPEKPAYKRIDVTDALHDAFGYRTDYKAMSK